MCVNGSTCKYNPDYFPSFLIEAKLNETHSVKNKCMPLHSRNLKFVKTNCEADPEKPHWCHCENAHATTVGFKHTE